MVEVGELFFEGDGLDERFWDFRNGLVFLGEEDVPDHSEEADDAKEDEHFADLAGEDFTAG